MWLFASYSRKDETTVEELIADLERAHLSVWHDQELRGGDPWWQDILRRIRQCDVFLFALSQNSLTSKPCLAELSYARALGLAILPVQVGPVGNLRLTPVADLQVIDYRERTPAKGMALLDAIQERVSQRRPVPEPLPDPPPVPFEYLLRLGTAIGAVQLTPDQQGDFIRQLRECLETEEDEAVRDDARELLRALRRRPDITYRNAQAVDRLLDDLAVSAAQTAEGAAAGRSGPGFPDGSASAAAAGGSLRDRHATGSSRATPPRRDWSRLVKRALVGGVVLLTLAALGTGLLLMRSAAALRTAVLAEPADQIGPYPPYVLQPADAVPGQQPATPTSGTTVLGNTPGLYGGTGGNVCDVEAMASYLAARPDMAAAWAAVQRIQPAEIPTYLRHLTPVVLRTDTAVKNHGYGSGQATAFESVLQAGTAVLVDEHGVPRVRCACGNPLDTPGPRPQPSYGGAPWKALSSETVTVIEPAPETVDVFVIVEADNRVTARPAHTRGEQDSRATPDQEAAARQQIKDPASGPSAPAPTTAPATPSGRGGSGGSSATSEHSTPGNVTTTRNSTATISRSATPEPTTPEPTTPEPTTPEPMTPEPATPEPTTPEPTAGPGPAAASGAPGASGAD